MKRIITALILLTLATPALADGREGHVSFPRGLAEQGDSFAQYFLGTMYEEGHRVPQDYAQAEKWYRKSAEQGFARAQYRLGVFYGLGRGVPEDFVQAEKWYRKAAEQGHAAAQFFLGYMYTGVSGVLQDYVQAHKWLNLAATLGHKNAVKQRDLLAKRMTLADISKAQNLAAQWYAAYQKRKGK
jgi:uncharacterized protein